MLQTALRETKEELGIAASDVVRVLGKFHDAMAITSIPVTPVVGFLGQYEALQFAPSQEEISDVFALQLEELLDPSKYEFVESPLRGRLPQYNASIPIVGTRFTTTTTKSSSNTLTRHT